MLDDLDLSSIPDERTRRAVEWLLNLMETLQGQLLDLREENQHLKDEVARLKGEQGRPKVNPQRGQGGPGLRALARSLCYGTLVSKEQVLALFRDAGTLISSGGVAHLLVHGHGRFPTGPRCLTGLSRLRR